ncbi:hypothetical protein U1Q18_041236 [Sarracenia purpurea var. burkii]
MYFRGQVAASRRRYEGLPAGLGGHHTVVLEGCSGDIDKGHCYGRTLLRMGCYSQVSSTSVVAKAFALQCRAESCLFLA